MKRLLALLLCLCLAFCGCAADESAYVPTGDGLNYDEDYVGPVTPNSNDTQKPQSLILPYYKNQSLNPYLCTDFTNRSLLTLIYQGLFFVDRNYTADPILCKSFTVTNDLKTYTFYLEQATFSNGTTLTADDVVASLTAAQNSAFYKGRFLHVAGITKTSDGGVMISLNTPVENLPLLLDIPIVPASQVDAANPLGTGPYTLYSASGGDSLRKRANWWCHPKMSITAETITLFSAESPNHIRDQFEFADLSLACVDPGSDRYADYRCDFELWDCENGIFLYLATSKDSEVFKNDDLRIALTYAVDRDLLVSDYYRDFARAATLPASPLFPYYSPSLAAHYAYAPDKFAEAVSKSGMSDHNIVFLVNSDDSLRVRVARKIAQMLKAGGLTVTMKELGTSAYTKALKNREYDIYLGQTRLSPTMDLSAFFATYGDLSWGGLNDIGAYNLSLQAVENHGNYFSLHKMVMDNGLLCPLLFRSYAIYSSRGLFADLNPSRDNIFYYSLGKVTEQIRTFVE